jgi:hypothetical protein
MISIAPLHLLVQKETTAITNVEIKNTNIKSRYDEDQDFGPAALLISDEDGLNYGRFNDITIRNNKIMRANYGIYCKAYDLFTGYGSGLLITENDLNDAADPLFHCGIYVAGVDGAVISKNKIANIDGSYTQNDKGIEISYYTTNTIVEANTINTLTGPSEWGAHGIYISSYETNANVLVKNNVIFNITGIGYNYITGFMNNPHGICLEYAQSGIKIYNNSIHLYGNTLNELNAISSGIALGTGSIADVRNNIIVNTLGLQNVTGYGRVGIFLQTDAAQLSSSSNNNLIYVNPLSGSGVKHIGQIGTSGLATIQFWRSVTDRDKYSFSGDPVFTSNTNLLPDNTNPNCWAVNNKGMPLADVDKDFTGFSRSTTVAGGPVDIGAYEFTAGTPPPAAEPSGPPTNNGTTTYIVFEFEAGSITWSGTSFPSSIDFRFYSGIVPPKPNHPDKSTSKCYWDITRSTNGGSDFTYNITFNYDEAQIGNIAESNLRIAKSTDNGSSWTPFLAAIPNELNNTITVNGLDGFSLFTLTDVNDPLPVELNSFTAVPSGRDINLKWETETEVSSYGFEIERSQMSNVKSQTEWTKIGFVAGHGNSNSPKQYSFTDNNLNSGKYIYRLKMVDNDGSYEYSPEVESEIGTPKDYVLSQNYPNPFNPTTKIEYQLPFESNVNIELYNITGERVDVLVNQEQAAGYYTVEVSSTQYRLSSGVYIYRMTAVSTKDLKNYTQLKKMVLLK